MRQDNESAAGDGGNQTNLGPLGHLPPPNSSSPSTASSTTAASTTLLAPASLSDTIVDVTPFIPMVLDLQQHNYYHWRHLFVVHLGRYGLRRHIDAGAPPTFADPQWVKDDFAVLQWIYTRISTELFGLLPKDGATAAVVWSELQQLFQDNRDARVQQLETEMRTIQQREEPVGQYCQRLKAMADELRELGTNVGDRTITTCLLNGISEKFDKVSSLIPLLRPAPPFSEVRSMLQREEQTMIRKGQQHSAFYSTNKPQDGGSQQPTPQPRQPSQQRLPGVSPNYKGKNPIPGFQHQPRPSTSSGSTSSTLGGATPSMTAAPRPHADPWMGLVQAWHVPWATDASYGAAPCPMAPSWQPTVPAPRPVGGPGLLGRPPPQAYTMYAPLHQPAPSTPTPFVPTTVAAPLQHIPSAYMAPLTTPPPTALSAPASSSTSAPPSWDQAAFLHAMNTYTNGNDGGWIMDSGASAHMSGSSGPGYSSTDRAAQ